MWGDLTDKNYSSDIQTLDYKRPYWEASFGIHNIFKLLHIEYVRRFNYLDLPTAHKRGVRLMLRMTF